MNMGRITGKPVGLPAAMLILLSFMMVVTTVPSVAGAPSGKYFDHVVLIAMENQNYADVLGDGHGSANAPFLASLLSRSGTGPNYHSGLSPGCSEGCYVQLVAGDDYGASNGVTGISATNGTIFGRFDTAGVTWQAFCESGCPRGGDHFPFLAINGLDAPGKVNADATTADLVSALNSANPPNFAWFTPTDSNNMHDNSVNSGDAYLRTFLVGTGTLDNPSQGSLLASNVFKPGMRTVLVLWWDEYDPAPFLLYGETVKRGYISSSADQSIYSTTHTLLENWGLAPLTSNDSGAPSQSEYFSVSSAPVLLPIISMGTFEWILVFIIIAVVAGFVATRKLDSSRKSATLTRTSRRRE